MYSLLEPIYEISVDDKKLKFYTPNRKCIYWLKTGPHSEPSTNKWINSFSNDAVLVDIGANIGLYSLLAAARGIKRVYAIEANPFTFSVLSRNIIINELSEQIVALCMPINEFSSIISFNLSSTEAGTVGNEIANENSNLEKSSIMTASFSMDQLFHIHDIRNVTHLKLDVDGMENGILRGAKKLLSGPTLKSILVEDIDGHKSKKNKLDKFMLQYGYLNTIIWGQDGSANKIFEKTTS